MSSHPFLTQLPEDCPLPNMSRRKILLTLFIEYFKISLFIVGGGYAIIIVADEVFGSRLKWIEEGELLDNLPLFQTIPGLIAGNSAIYVGMKAAGLIGSVVALAAIALPSMIIITAIAMGFSWLPMDNPLVQGAFIGLRAALCGIVLATTIKSWRKIMSNAYALIAAPLATIAIVGWGVSAQRVLITAIVFGVLTFTAILPIVETIRNRKAIR